MSSRFFAAATLAFACGCTMCPDPHDYSGPVPNGSAPQNDFRARSNGIIPIGTVPKPWPLIVDHPPTMPATADRIRVPDLVAKALADDIGPEDDASMSVAHVSAEEAEPAELSADEAGPEEVGEVDLAPVTDEPAADEPSVDEPVVADHAVHESDDVESILPPPAERASEIPVGPVPRETPGWRPRSQ